MTSYYYAVIDLFDGGTGRTIVSKHRTMEAAEAKCDAMNRRAHGGKQANRHQPAKYGVAQIERGTDTVIASAAGGW